MCFFFAELAELARSQAASIAAIISRGAVGLSSRSLLVRAKRVAKEWYLEVKTYKLSLMALFL